jgi:hypothetical protein
VELFVQEWAQCAVELLRLCRDASRMGIEPDLGRIPHVFVHGNCGGLLLRHASAMFR